MTDKQRKYIESLVKKVFRNADSQSEILSRLDRVKISSHQASVMIHALKLEYNIGRILQYNHQIRMVLYDKDNMSWKNVISNNEYWLYVDDLLPKEGGEQ